MSKRMLSLYVDSDIIELAKNRGIVLSRFFNELLRLELSIKELSDTTTKEELITKLKSRMSILTDELKLANEKISILEKENKSLLEKKKDNKKAESKNIVLMG